mmetsp:Transcript_16892/g.35224  ORF Transcript_16892/g.35224 Transcript_16892/m.35224 type:complete len:348 (-) Transcript_16892:126-1169(-)|eukprot:CAMPEP_0171439230 /NCGR_PEP_ID=MMETSP0881-20121228/19970_1 /TAXON_ID=67004 /ORGANISM="Thalassiosira weissflogii, Strain CCMP1336" /LENGTH=347 /DNA_ID=CAMNT_0011961351 /DNA_START=9 /DNA_END=1052 /DNA_ORIENTATION=-
MTILPYNHGKRGSKSKSSTVLPVLLGIVGFAAWAISESNSSIWTFSAGPHDSGVSNAQRSLLAKAVGDVTLTSDEAPSQKFIVVSQQQGYGTSFIASLLDKHPNIRFGNEELFHKLHKRPLAEAYENESLDEYMAQIELSMELLEHLTGDNVDDPMTHVGFEVMYDQGIMTFDGDLFRELNKRDVKVIHYVRKNKLLQYVSKELYHKDNTEDSAADDQSTEQSGEDAPETQTHTVNGNRENILNFIVERAGENSYIDDLLFAECGEDNYHTVYYEDLRNDSQGEMNRMFDFLGVNHEEIEGDLPKELDDKHIKEYFNEDDRDYVEKAIKEAGYKSMLDADVPHFLGW